MVNSVIVLGAGSAGLLAAISLKRKLPQLQVRVVRSPDIGVIGVGEGTIPSFPRHLFEYLGIKTAHFYQHASPTWKIGIKFLWGPRPQFFYSFGLQLDSQWPGLSRPTGYYCDDSYEYADLPSALMAQGKAFPRLPNGLPDIQPWHAFHIENKKLVEVLEGIAKAAGVEFIDGKVAGATRGPAGIASVHLEDGRSLEADFFIDASGFRSELLSRTLEEPYISYDKSLFCDRAVIGGWERTDEPILPYTTAETMNSGWSWQIEHETFVNRGYVYASGAISDDAARDEFLQKNPKAPQSARTIKFRSGRYRRSWVDNVAAIGNSCGFVEPLEATALMMVCVQCQTLADFFLHTGSNPTPTMRRLYNDTMAGMWDEIRDFLAIHYKFNSRLDTPFWRQCRSDTDVSAIAELLQFYDENGPTGFARHLLHGGEANFGIEGFLVMLVGNCVPYRGKYAATDAESENWSRILAGLTSEARGGVDVKEALGYIRHPGWQWTRDVATTPAIPHK